MSELKAFDVGLGRYTEDGYPCVVAFDADQNPRLLGDEKVYLKSEADREIARQKRKRCLALAKIASDNWHIHNSFYAMGKMDFEQKKCERYERHRLKWLAIADKFKEAK